MKPVRHAISVVIKNKRGETLFAKRSAGKSSYPLAWSLPSHYVAEGEKLAETAKRIGEGKLGIKLKAGRLLNEGVSDRGEFILFMHDYEGKIISGQPKIISDDYIELKWSEPKKQLDSMTVMGDCCRLYREYLEK